MSDMGYAIGEAIRTLILVVAAAVGLIGLAVGALAGWYFGG